MINPMKDSGVEWIGEIPSDWTVTRLKFITKGNLQYGANAEGIDYDERLPRYIRITDIDSNNNLKDSGKQSLQVIIAKPYILKKGDLLFARSGATVGKTFLFQSDTLSAFAGYLIKYSPIESIESRFIYYMTLGNGYDNWKNSIFSQSTIQNIGADKYSNLPVALPCKKIEQKAIANFLDEETKKLDAAKSLLQQQIEKLKEYRKSLIWETVTKGLDKTVPMKDSGLDWIGKVPDHWSASRIKFFSKISAGGTPNRNIESFWDGEINWMSSGEINQKNVTHTAEKISDLGLKNSATKLLPKGTIMLALNGQGKTKGTTAILDIETTSNQSLASFIVDEINIHNKFIYYYFESQYQNIRGLKGEERDGLNLYLVSNINVPIPSYKEQNSIAKFLDKKTFIIEEIISNTLSQIEIIDKQKKTLIYDYVTGKRRVKL